MRPAGAIADRATARLGSILHVKGEISGNEDRTLNRGGQRLEDSSFVIRYSSAPAPAAGVAGADAVREHRFFPPSFSALFSILIEPLKHAPSSMMICAVVKSPFTEPSFLISILPFPWTLPFTLPYTTTSPAMTSAVNFAVAPTVSFRSSSWTSPSTVPSMYGPTTIGVFVGLVGVALNAVWFFVV